MEINNELRDRAFNCAKAHGFHDVEHSNAHWLMLIITEISEAVNADRNGKRANKEHVEYELTNLESKGYFARGFDYLIKGSIEEELADIVIRCLDFAGERKLDITIDLSDVQPISVGEDGINTFTDFMFCTSAFLFSQTTSLQIRLLAVIGCMLGYAKQFNIDLLWQIEQKMKYNELCPMLNGKKY